VREIIDDIDRWRTAGKKVAVARVIKIEGSGPRDPGAAMAVNQDGEVAGSVSGGCVEGAVVSEALEIIASGGPGRMVSFGYSDDEAFAVGLTCGGTIRLFIEPLDWRLSVDDAMSLYERFRDLVRRDVPVALATIVEGPGVGSKLMVVRENDTEIAEGTLGHPELDRVVARDTAGELEAGRTGVRHYGPEGQATPEDLVDTPTLSVFVESFSPPPQMWIFGAVDFTAALGRVAKALGYRVTVCDAREIFATKRRFPMADEVVVSWPTPMFESRGHALGPRDAVCILTHDPKFDVPAVQGALSSRVGYIGVMGSRKTHAKRLERLAEVGVNDPADLARLMSPIGLDLGGRTPEETAVAICAEIIARRTGHGASSLRDTSGSIHS